MDLHEKSKTQLACELIQVLDGLSLEIAKSALLYACDLLQATQVVKADSPLLLAKRENDRALPRD